MQMEKEVTIEIADQTYSGFYTVTSGRHPIVKISSEYGTKATQVGGATPESIARIMLRELVEESKA